MTDTLVCPTCKGTNIGTLEAAVIWQRASFTSETDVDWDMYDSEDVGDTDTVGWFCSDCIQTWDKDNGFPFVADVKADA